MMPDNIQWGFFSKTEYQRQVDVAAAHGTCENLKDTYYKDFNGKWVRVTAVFDCIEKARKTYRMTDATYLGAVLINTKTEVPRGSAFPPVEKTEVPSSVKQKIEVMKNRKRSIFDEQAFGYGYKHTYFDDASDTW